MGGGTSTGWRRRFQHRALRCAAGRRSIRGAKAFIRFIHRHLDKIKTAAFASTNRSGKLDLSPVLSRKYLMDDYACFSPKWRQFGRRFGGDLRQWAAPASARPAINALTLMSRNSGRSAGVMPPVIDSSRPMSGQHAARARSPRPLLPAG